MNLRKIELKATLFGAGLVLAAIAAEMAVRLFLPEPMWKIVDAAEDWQPDNRLGWVQKPNYLSVSRRASGQIVRFETNPDGLQPAKAKREKQPGSARIMLFGDSAIVGRSVPETERIHSQLQTLLLKAGCRAEVINAGVEGYSTDQSLIRMQMLLPLYAPDIAIHCVCANDFVSNGKRDNSGLNKPRFVIRNRGDLIEEPPEPNAKLMQRKRGVISWIRRSAVYGLARPKILVLRAGWGTWEDRNLLGLNDAIYYDPAALQKLDGNLFGALLGKMKSVAESRGAMFLVYSVPDVLEVWDPWIAARKKALRLGNTPYDRHALEKRIQQTGLQTGVVCVPMVDYFETRQERGPFHLIPADRHCNGAGYQLTAEVLTQPVVSALENRPGVVDTGGN